MVKGDPKGKMASYAFFVQTCQEEHKKKHPDCSERWKTMSATEKGKIEDMAKADQARYEREMKTYILPKGKTKKFKDPSAPKRPPSVFFLFCSEYYPKIKWDHPGLSIGDPYEKKAAKLKEKYEKDTAAEKSKKKKEEEKDEEDEEDEEE
ncbi:hypothetical protein FD755_000061 [Muntiacus reevesi]|uniref:HMG box domain-containing protein n=1 Tax=Muntiacus reevesi TaxID=9886 RepID=A0A5J5MXT2_MUNRE|nr:hypothetical protein FD755_000061 [Muntiacus reevesi]